ncbi:hypothetical protein RCL_jg15392.t1 [Rhizophagus clarus]|uniref:Uncharacterized protein n=1 Tax=Rhizophagus clarus TaxID=94130 RepID=A0A8H3QBE3_9GLOM|nr:hypothetical protein RCL_jg15392.t1 [Rhizophagus clarus]
MRRRNHSATNNYPSFFFLKYIAFACKSFLENYYLTPFKSGFFFLRHMMFAHNGKEMELPHYSFQTWLLFSKHMIFAYKSFLHYAFNRELSESNCIPSNELCNLYMMFAYNGKEMELPPYSFQTWLLFSKYMIFAYKRFFYYAFSREVAE